MNQTEQAGKPAQPCDITLFVPAFNEAARIAATLHGLARLVADLSGPTVQILVVDDGSSDHTVDIVRQVASEHPLVELVQHGKNLGLGNGLRTALAHARGRKFLIVPGDNDMPPSTIKLLLSNAASADMVMCYFLNREQRGRMRNLVSTAFGLIYTSCFDIFVQYINGPSVYRVDHLRQLELFSTRFSIVAEINVKLLRQGVSFLEVPSYRQTGLAGSSSFSLRNLMETVSIFCRLFYEVHFKSRSRYAHRPVRVMPVSTSPVPSALD